jgi:hypothetical protein
MKPALKSAALIGALICSCVARAGTESGDPGKMQWAPSRTYHVENYKLTLHFSQSRGEVFGDELVTIRPFAAGFDRFCINSAELTIDSVTMAATAGTAAALAHTTDDHCLWIGLNRTYGPSDSLNIRIVYHGHPRIGLFFVNPGRNDRDAPREV